MCYYQAMAMMNQASCHRMCLPSPIKQRSWDKLFKGSSKHSTACLEQRHLAVLKVAGQGLATPIWRTIFYVRCFEMASPTGHSSTGRAAQSNLMSRQRIKWREINQHIGAYWYLDSNLTTPKLSPFRHGWTGIPFHLLIFFFKSSFAPVHRK